MQKISDVRDALGLSVECRRTAHGMFVGVSGVVTVREYSAERITLVTHRGSVTLLGEKISMSVFANQSVELSGGIRGIEFNYGKN